MRLPRSSLQCPLRPLQSKPYLIGISIKYLLGLDRRHYSDSTDDNDRVRRVWWEKGGLEEFSYERKRRERTPSQKRPNLFPVKGQHQLVKNSNPYLSISDEIFTAVLSGKPVVALESTIYTHGFPFPDNILLALDLERVVRSYGAIPATIGIIDGVARIGLTSEEIKILASGAGNPETMKVSRRDIPYILGMGVLGKKLNGGTTVAATMLLASRAGISVFGTGGIGGVHRGAKNTMDISADLTELGRTSVGVIASGCKSFLDIPRTLEYLETQGATVCTFADGRTGPIDFPAFYTRESGVKSPMVIQTPLEAAAMIFAQDRSLSPSSRSGLLFANPIPEQFSMPKAAIEDAINQAVQEATKKGFHGHQNTPFILAKIKELTKGNSLPANRALIKSNVAMASQVAVELSKLRRGLEPTSSLVNVVARPNIIVIGSVAVDLSSNYSPEVNNANPSTNTSVSPEMHTSNIATITPSVGGVGYNVARAAQRAGKRLSVSLRSMVAEDLAGHSILSAMQAENFDTSGIWSRVTTYTIKGEEKERRTAQYVSVNDTKRHLVMAMADMSIFDDRLNENQIKRTTARLLQKPIEHDTWIVLDANWSPSILSETFRHRDVHGGHMHMVFEPVSVPKAGRIFEPGDLKNSHKLRIFPKHDIHLSTPNQYELAAMYATAKRCGYFERERWWEVIDALGIPSSGARDRFVSITGHKLTDEGIPLQTVQLLPYIPTILTKLGAEGVLLTELLKPNDPRLADPDAAPFILSRTANGSDEVGGVYMRLFPPVEMVENIESVNGAGDTFLGVLVAGLAQGCKVDEDLIDIAQRGAVLTLKSKESVSPELGVLSAELAELGRETRAERLRRENQGEL